MAVQQRAVLTRTRVISAAANVFSRMGYGAATLNDITTEAEATKGALYFHFASKDALAVAIIEEHIATWPALIDPVTAAAPDPLTAVVALSYEAAAQFREDPILRAGVVLSLERDLVKNDEEVPFTSWIESVQTLLTSARKLGLLRAGVKPAEASRAVVASFLGLQRVSEVFADRKDLETRLDEFWKIFIVGLAADPDWATLQRAARKTLSAAHAS